MKRRLRYLLAALALLLALFLIPTLWFKPWTAEHLYVRAVARMTLDSPTTMTELGILDGIGLDYYNDELDDLSIEFAERQLDRVDRELALLRTYDRNRVSDRLAYDLVEWFLDDLARGRPFRFHNYPVNQLFGLQSRIPDFMINTHPLRDEGNARDYLARIAQFPRAFDQVMAGLRHRQTLGILPPRFILERVIADLREFLSPAPREHPLYRHFADVTGEIEGLDQKRRAAMLERLAGLIADGVYPAYDRLVGLLEDQRAVATGDAGVWKLPDGDAYYAQQLRHHTTTDLGADELHRLGLAEVDALQAEMRTILEAEGYDAADLGATVGGLATEERFLYADAPESRDRILERYREIIADVERALPPLFGELPTTALEVEAVPDYRQEGAPQAYYEPGSLDGARPGTFYANLRNVREIPRYAMRTLVYHEALPGHHLQISLHLTHAPLLRKVMPFIVPFNAYLEGWAHYAERLADEHGLFADPYDRLGYLQGQLLRAVRLVVDTGIHARRWSREEAVGYMLAATGMPEGEVRAEIDRYIVFPGQACAYKVGQLELLRLRQRARDQLGDRFDLGAFHDAVLTHGVLPLAVLGGLVDEWIEEVGASGRPGSGADPSAG